MLSTLSIRTRLTLIYTALLFVALTAFASAAVAMLHYRLTLRLEASLDHKLEGLEGFLRRETRPERAFKIPEEALEYALTQPESHLIHVTDAEGNVVLRGERASELALTRERQFELYGQTYRARASGSLGPVNETTRELRLLLWWSAPFLLLLISASAYWVTRQALAPVDRMTHAASSISVHNLEHRLPVFKAGDELSRLALAWNGMLSRLQESVDRMRRFTADAAHELRTPLTALRTTAELALRRPRSAGEYQQALRQVVSVCEQMTRLADDLLSLARADEHRQPVHPRPLDLKLVIGSVLADMEPLFASKHQEVQTEFPEDAAVVEGVEPDLRRLVTSLVENATKYTPDGGTIKAVLRDTGDGYDLDVADSGPGIPVESMGQVFDRFYRVDPSRDRQSGGHGLGLAIARQIAHAHDGTIHAIPRPNGGACIRVRLPKLGGRWLEDPGGLANGM